MNGDVSVLLATYNSAPYVLELVDSILAGEYRDFELLVRDDASTDETATILRGITDERVRVTVSDVQSGSAQNNFYQLLLGCDNDYIMFADADDFWLPEKIGRTREKMRALEAQYGSDTPLLVHTDLAVADAQLNIIAPSLFAYERLSPRRDSLKNLLVQNNVTGCTVMINRALRALVREQPAHSVMHDWWLALCAAAFGHIGVVDEPLILYRQHGGNEVGAYDAGDLLASAKKLTRRARMRAVYASMFAQAGCFAETFRDKLTPAQYALCADYGAMAARGKAARIASVLKHGYYKNTLLRNLGQFLAI
ncbi:MAG: glycosyltransferase family 2 protein [Oscillospiraceae bacterium]|nr:glycosyltransferase family 2 protein [Oscillospiraceae bacterium]